MCIIDLVIFTILILSFLHHCILYYITIYITNMHLYFVPNKNIHSLLYFVRITQLIRA